MRLQLKREFAVRCILRAKGAPSFELGATPQELKLSAKRALKARFRPKIGVVREVMRAFSADPFTLFNLGRCPRLG